VLDARACIIVESQQVVVELFSKLLSLANLAADCL